MLSLLKIYLFTQNSQRYKIIFTKLPKTYLDKRALQNPYPKYTILPKIYNLNKNTLSYPKYTNYFSKNTPKIENIFLYRGSYMSAYVLLFLLNKLGRSDKMSGLPPLSRTNFHILNVFQPLKFDCIWDNYRG